MSDRDSRKEEKRDSSADGFRISAPAVALPKGGGTIRGIGEKFAADPVTGAGTLSVPIFTSPGRSEFGRQLSLSYDSGADNGPFSFGSDLSIPSITHKTDKGLPRYQDSVESDVFILSGAEDMVNEWVPEKLPEPVVDNQTYIIRRLLLAQPRLWSLWREGHVGRRAVV
jgi:hypothetical protein